MLLDILKNLDSIPNAPFSVYPIQTFLKNFVSNTSFELISNPYYSYINVVKNPGSRKLLLFCHTDHPAFVFKNSNSGVLFGKYDLQKLKLRVPFKIDVFDTFGKKVLEETVISLEGRSFITQGSQSKVNFTARFALPTFYFDIQNIYMYSADNYLGVASLLSLLKPEIAKSEFDLYFVFNHFEEVFQLGSWQFAYENQLKITYDDIVINIDAWHKKDPNEEVTLYCAEKGCAYGIWSSLPNLAIPLVERSGLNTVLYSESNSSSDARVLDYFKLTPNLVSLGIPIDNVHNMSKEGNLCLEVVSTNSANKLFDVLTTVIKSPANFLTADKNINKKDLSNNHNLEFLSNSAKDNIKYSKLYKRSVARGYFFHKNILDKVLYLHDKLFS